MDVKQLANQLNAWVDATSIKITQNRYLAHGEADPLQKDSLLAEAIALERISEEIQACVRVYATLRRLRPAIQANLQWIEQERDRWLEAYQNEMYADKHAVGAEGYAQAYTHAAKTLRQIVGPPSQSFSSSKGSGC